MNVLVPPSTRSFLRANFFLSCDQLPTLIPLTDVFFLFTYSRSRHE